METFGRLPSFFPLQMQTLSRVCCDCLRKCYVNEDTAASLLLFAQRLQLAELRKTSAEFVLLHRDKLAPDQAEILGAEEVQRVLEEFRGKVRLKPAEEAESGDSDSSPGRDGCLLGPGAEDLVRSGRGG